LYYEHITVLVMKLLLGQSQHEEGFVENVSFRSWLLEQMRVWHLNQSQLARRLDVAPSLISRYINHGVVPRADVVDKLARNFRVDVDVVRDLVGLEPADRPVETLRAGEVIGMVKRVDWRDDTKFNTISAILRLYLDEGVLASSAR
jgi:transcriptional regulator with XRE-family HTH domain